MSLNSVLLSGPDLTNSLLGILIRFRRESIAIAADIEQMFYSFEVDEDHRNYLRFFWYQDNDPNQPLIEYRMCRHVFGNSPSPAIATYGLCKSVESSETDVHNFVNQDFYVDDGLTSLSCPEKAVNLLKRTQHDLLQSSLRLHKIASNSGEVLAHFPKSDLAKDLKSLAFEDELPVQRSLGLLWSLNSDNFIFEVESPQKSLSRRNILSMINSVFDPLGFLAPILIVGKLILRDIIREGCDWDEPVSPEMGEHWSYWLQSLQLLSNLKVPRSYFMVSMSELSNIELHVFCDASEKAISAVAYLVGLDVDNCLSYTGFVIGKSKIAPSKGHTVPRLELCAAVLSVTITQIVTDNLSLSRSSVKYYSDSKIVLGYIHNQSRRFFTYVSNRVQKIRHFSDPMQWNYVPTQYNPADIGSRGAGISELLHSPWLNGPSFLQEKVISMPEFFPLVEPKEDKEIRSVVSVLSTNATETVCMIGCSRFERFSSWKNLIIAFSVLKCVASFHFSCSNAEFKHTQLCSDSLELRQNARNLILKEVQLEVFRKEIQCLKNGFSMDKRSPILSLDPFLDLDGVLRVGGRLAKACCSFDEKHPIIIPRKHHIARLIVSHFHQKVKHQGRHLTEGAVRTAGYWVVGGRRLITSMIFHCVKCRKLRGKYCAQKMSDLPVDRVVSVLPFTYVGVDVFGPWTIVSRRTRGGKAASKRWAVLFTCLTIRAVHIEVIEDMSSSCFINSLRRFIAIRGKVKQFRSDRGTNFVGATEVLHIHSLNVEDEKTRSFLRNNDCVWLFNSPHSSHMGGSWERMIGIARRILESILSNVKSLTHEILVTLMAEVSAIINARPIVPVSSDPQDPEVLSPSALLTCKIECDQRPIGDLDIKLLYKKQWQKVQYLADQFWLKWRHQYLQGLQSRNKWKQEQSPLAVGDLVLLKCYESVRNHWPLARILRVFPGDDGRIRKVEISVFKDGKVHTYIRPVVDLVLLVANET